ncbi:MAG: hypothetical protein ACO1RA_20945 [Planctomycetaceae bacterium]
MNSAIRCGMAIVLSALICLGVLASSVFADEGQLQSAIKAWQNSQVGKKTARFELKAECFVAKEAYVNINNEKRFPEQDERFTQTIELYLDFANHRSRRKCVRKIYNLTNEEYEHEVLVNLFNGTDYTEYMPRKENLALNAKFPKFTPELLLYGAKRNTFFFRAEEVPIFLSFGFVSEGVAEPELKPLALDTGHYEIVPHPNRDESTLVIRLANRDPKRHKDFYVDPAKGFGITRVSRYVGGSEFWRAEIQLKPVGDAWIPESWRIVNTSADGRLEIEEKVQVTSMAFDEAMPDSLFEQTAEEGMVVVDQRTNSHYIAGKPGEKNIPVSEAVRESR